MLWGRRSGGKAGANPRTVHISCSVGIASASAAMPVYGGMRRPRCWIGAHSGDQAVRGRGDGRAAGQVASWAGVARDSAGAASSEARGTRQHTLRIGRSWPRRSSRSKSLWSSSARSSCSRSAEMRGSGGSRACGVSANGSSELLGGALGDERAKGRAAPRVARVHRRQLWPAVLLQRPHPRDDVARAAATLAQPFVPTL